MVFVLKGAHKNTLLMKPMQFLHMEIYTIDMYRLSENYVCHQEYLAEWL
jgi:hypothetical protein